LKIAIIDFFHEKLSKKMIYFIKAFEQHHFGRLFYLIWMILFSHEQAFSETTVNRYKYKYNQ